MFIPLHNGGVKLFLIGDSTLIPTFPHFLDLVEPKILRQYWPLLGTKLYPQFLGVQGHT